MDHEHAVDLAIEHLADFAAAQPPPATAVQLSLARSRTDTVAEPFVEPIIEPIEAIEVPLESAWQRTLGVRRLVLDLAVVALIALLGYTFWPAPLGGSTSYVIVKGTSMEPKFHTGDLAFVREQDRYKVGDIVAYRIPKGSPAAGNMVIHRIVGFHHGGYLMKGDNRDTPDGWNPTAHDVVGRYRMLLPLPGMQFWVWIPWIFAGLIGIGVMWILWPRTILIPFENDGDGIDTNGEGTDEHRDGADDNGTAPDIGTPVIVGQRRLRRLELEAQKAKARARRRRPWRSSRRAATGLSALALVVAALAIAA